jgi:hypothetical protein
MRILRPERVTSFPGLRSLTPVELKQAYALARASFTAKDLYRNTDVDEGVSAAEVLRALEKAEQQLGEGSP